MEREVIPYTTEKAWLEERLNDLTSSDIPVLFGQGYTDYETLSISKREKTPIPFTSNERVDWGKALQDAIAEEFGRRYKWDIRKKSEYIRIKGLRIGSSFDYSILCEAEDSKGEAYSYEALLEIKNVDKWEYKEKWVQEFEIEATPYIELQVQHQLLVSGLQNAYIGVLIGGNEGKILKRTANDKIHQAILQKCEKFWKEIDEQRKNV